jgi:hypothetical protein
MCNLITGEISKFDTQFDNLSTFDSQFVASSKFDTREFFQEKGLTPYYIISPPSGTILSCEETKIPLLM